MRIFRIDANVSKYALLSYVNDLVSQQVPMFTGQSLVNQWSQSANLPVYRITEYRNQELESDFYGFRGARSLAVNGKAMKCLMPLIGGRVEYLPLNCPDGEYYAMNVIEVVDCLDLDSARIVYSPSRETKWITGVKYKGNGCGDSPIFVLPSQYTSRIYISDTFKDVVEANGLRGLIFTELRED